MCNNKVYLLTYLHHLFMQYVVSGQRLSTVCIAQAIEEPFVTAVKEALGDRFTPTMEVIYRKIIKFILTTLTTGFMYYDIIKRGVLENKPLVSRITKSRRRGPVSYTHLTLPTNREV